MPELPEVECIVNDLRCRITGKRINEVTLFFSGMLKGITADDFSTQIINQQVEHVQRKGKYILIFFRGDLVLEVHLRMTGSFLYVEKDVEPVPYARAAFFFAEGGILFYRDVRKFGTFRLFTKESLSFSPSLHLGADPLEDSFDFTSFQKIIQKKATAGVKSFLLNQKNISGMGNIYVDESLFRARIHPLRKAGSLSFAEQSRLYRAIQETLREGISLRGTSISDYRDLFGRPGFFQQAICVYRREKKPCPRCPGIIRRIRVGGRGTYHCPECQQERAGKEI